MREGDRVKIGRIDGNAHPDNGKTGVIDRKWGRDGWHVKLDDGSGCVAVYESELTIKPRRKKK